METKNNVSNKDYQDWNELSDVLLWVSILVVHIDLYKGAYMNAV